MKTLYKLDLEPNEIYNVSVNIKQGNKTVDNLRFFQTRVPKLFNIKIPNFTTSSRIIEKPDAIVKTQSSGGFVAGGDVTLNVKSISWTEQKTGDFSEGQINSTPSQVTYNFTINLSGPPKMMGYQLSGFTGSLDFLNFRNDYTPSGNTLKLSLTLSEIDSVAAASILNTQTTKTYGLESGIKKGETRLHLTGNIKGLVPGNTLVKVIYKSGPPEVSAFPTSTVVLGHTTGTNYVALSQPAIVNVPDTKEATFTSNANFNGFTGKYYKYLKGGKKDVTDNDGRVKDATFIYQTFPTFTAPSYKYTFGQNSFINSSVVNPNLLESLIWEDTVRDFVFFTIADQVRPEEKYFFGTYGDIQAIATLATKTTSLVGSILFDSDNPPYAPDEIVSSTEKSPLLKTGEVRFYDSGKITETTESSPQLKRAIIVCFAVARYTENSSGWTGKWLGGVSASEILSSPEAIE